MTYNEITLQTFFQSNNKHSFEIPKYQRGYSWNNENIKDFWDDLQYTNNDYSYRHFFGTIYISQSRDRNKPDHVRIVDGQQRITTVAIFLICVRDYFFGLQDTVPLARQCFDQIQRILYKLDLRTYEPDTNRFILTLSITNKDFFNNFIVPVKKTSEKLRIKDDANNDSDEYLADAYVQISKLIKPNHSNPLNHVQKLNHMTNTLINQFALTPIEVSNDAQAYHMFDLINNRGMQLSQSDLVKNRLFGQLHESFGNESYSEDKMDCYDRKWAEIRNNVTGKDKGNDELDNFLHQYLIAFKLKNDPQSEITKSVKLKRKDIFAKFKDLLKSEKPDAIIEDLWYWSEKFVNLRLPQTKFAKYPDAYHYLTRINTVAANNVYSVLFAGYKNYWEDKDKNLFVRLTELCFKYHIRAKSLHAGVVLSTYEHKLVELVDIINNDTSDIQKLVDKIVGDDKAYPNNDKIELHLRDLQVINKNLAIALLEEIERTYDRDKISNTNVSIEHIMPKNRRRWNEYIKENHPDINNETDIETMHSKYFSLLGNQTLLGGQKNIKISNREFDYKKGIYKNDGYRITNQLKDVDKWTRNEIKQRQQEFSDKLLAILDLTKLNQ